jgi:hypothetical protein
VRRKGNRTFFCRKNSIQNTKSGNKKLIGAELIAVEPFSSLRQSEMVKTLLAAL